MITVKHTLLRELRLRVRAYDYRVAQHAGPVSASPVIEIARLVAENYAQARQERTAYDAARSRRIAAERKAKGLCRVCGEKPRRPERTSCAECGALEVRQAAKQYDTMRRKPKREG